MLARLSVTGRNIQIIPYSAGPDRPNAGILDVTALHTELLLDLLVSVLNIGLAHRHVRVKSRGLEGLILPDMK